MFSGLVPFKPGYIQKCSEPRPSSSLFILFLYPLLGTVYPYLRVQGDSWKESEANFLFNPHGSLDFTVKALNPKSDSEM